VRRLRRAEPKRSLVLGGLQSRIDDAVADNPHERSGTYDYGEATYEIGDGITDEDELIARLVDPETVVKVVWDVPPPTLS
jgi:hypothetical protein